MDSNMNAQEFPPDESSANYNSFASNSTSWQDSSSRYRSPGYYQGPYQTSNPRMRQRGDFQQRGRYSYSRRVGGGPHRSQNRDKNFDQQQDQSSGNIEYQSTSINSYNRNFNKFFRPNMLEDPWAHMKPQKVPSNGTSLVFDPTNH